MSRALYLRGAALLIALASAGPASALAADLPTLERAWHGCVRDAYDRQPERGSQAGRERNALDECKPHEDAFVAALMTARPTGAKRPVLAWARTWAAFVVDPLRDWTASLRR